jgi:autotransporter translocation and assembly factor TamB
MHIDQLSGRAGGGEFTLGGSLDFDHGPAVSWSLHEVALTFPEWLEERVSGKGRVEGTWKDIVVGGDIEVLTALYDRRIELTALLPWFKEQLTPAPQIEPPPREVHLDLRVHAPDGIFVDNNFAKAEMRCDLRIAGRVQEPRLDGLIEILDGEVTFRGRVFTVTGGSVEFRNAYPINPILSISAESQISTAEAEYTVSVAVSGTADKPRVQFSSDDPTLTQNDVLSLVTFGQTTNQPQREGSTVGVGNVLGWVPGDYDVRMRSLFGIDRLEVEPAYVRDTGAIEPRVTIGKDLTDRLRALASSSFGAEAQHSVQLEYRLTRRISLLSTWESRTQQREGAFGGDIKFRYEFRRLPFSLWNRQPCPAPNDAH